MRRTDHNVIIDMIAFIGFVAMTVTGVLMRYLLPPGSGHFSTIWHLDRHQWGDIHFWISMLFFFVLALHLLLHWRWLVSVMTGHPREGSALRAGLGIVGLITVIALSISLLLTPVERDSGSNKASSISGAENRLYDIRGSMSLKEIEDLTGVPATHLIEALQLPESTAATEKIGQLKVKYGIEPKDVRDVINHYKKTD